MIHKNTLGPPGQLETSFMASTLTVKMTLIRILLFSIDTVEHNYLTNVLRADSTFDIVPDKQ